MEDFKIFCTICLVLAFSFTLLIAGNLNGRLYMYEQVCNIENVSEKINDVNINK